MATQAFVLVLLLVGPEHSLQFSPCTQGSSRSRLMSQNDDTAEVETIGVSRRGIISSVLPAAIALSLNPQASHARDELFKPNPLTNRALEKIRILEQAEADNIKYGGELAPGSPQGREQYAKLLVPILVIQKELDEIYDLVRLPNGEGLEKADGILSKPQYVKIQFKKTFNAFGKSKWLTSFHLLTCDLH